MLKIDLLNKFPHVVSQILIKKNFDSYLIYDNQNDRIILGNEDFINLIKDCDGTKSIKELAELYSKQKLYSKEMFILQLKKLVKDKIISLSVDPKKTRINFNNVNLEYPLNLGYLEVTKNCNFNCIHCYLGNKSEEKDNLSKNDILQLINNLDSLGVMDVVITGGEPFLNKDLLEILEYIKKKNIGISILTNGSLLNKKIISQLSRLKIKRISISLESHKKNIFGKIRGPENFDKVISGIKLAINAKLPLEINVVLFDGLNNTKLHLKSFFRYLKKLGLKRKNIDCDIFLPVGCGKNIKKFVLDAKDTMDNLNFAKDAIFGKTKRILKKNPNIIISNSFCGLGREMVYIASNGDVFLCPGFIQKDWLLGNIKKTTLKEIWENSDKLKYFRQKEYLKDSKCNSCKYLSFCDGGCKARALALTGSLKEKDLWRCAYYESTKL